MNTILIIFHLRDYQLDVSGVRPKTLSSSLTPLAHTVPDNFSPPLPSHPDASHLHLSPGLLDSVLGTSPSPPPGLLPHIPWSVVRKSYLKPKSENVTCLLKTLPYLPIFFRGMVFKAPCHAIQPSLRFSLSTRPSHSLQLTGFCPGLHTSHQ